MAQTIEQQLQVITRGAVDVIGADELRKKLQEGRPLRVKAGFDPTAPDLHIGHTVLLRKLRQFQDLGHEVYFLIGDFTGRIGDPSGRTVLRKQLSSEEVLANAETYKQQVAKVLDLSRLRIVFNSSWLEKLSVADFLRLSAHATVSQMLARADFKKRYTSGDDISLLEFMYPLLQGYDSVELKADIELGGTDQIFNLLMGRELQGDFGQVPQVVLTMPLLEGLDGAQKMSKSYNNYIGISEDAGSMFGKVMSVRDELMLKYYELLTDEDLASVRTLHPKEAKMRLGEIIVGHYHSKDAARAARAEFERVFSQHELPAEMDEFALKGGMPLIDVLTLSGLVKTKNEARRLIAEGAVVLNEVRLDAQDARIQTPGVLRVGKRRFLRLVA